MVVEPAVCKVARPGLEAEKMATLLFDELQFVEEVTSWPFNVALNCRVVPFVERLTVWFAGEMVSVLEVEPTVSAEEPVTPPSVAVMVAVPEPTPLAKPELVMVAMAGAEELQVRLWSEAFVPSLLTPVAVNCSVEPMLTEEFCGATVMEVRVGLTKKPRQETPASATSTASANNGNTGGFDISQDSPPRWAMSCKWSRCVHFSKPERRES